MRNSSRDANGKFGTRIDVIPQHQSSSHISFITMILFALILMLGILFGFGMTIGSENLLIVAEIKMQL